MNNSICKTICNTIYNKVSSGAFLYGYAVVALLLPNIALCFTECLAPWVCGANVLLPLALYICGSFPLPDVRERWYGGRSSSSFSQPSSWCCSISSVRE